MDLLDQIDLALATHASWRDRLAASIRTGESDDTVALVADDTCCHFGLWLHHLPAEVRDKRHWREVFELHAQFHREAAAVLDLALRGQKAEAEQQLAEGKPFLQVSAQLGDSLRAWKATIKRPAKKKASSRHPLPPDLGPWRRRD